MAKNGFRFLGSNPGSIACRLCDLEHVVEAF